MTVVGFDASPEEEEEDDDGGIGPAGWASVSMTPVASSASVGPFFLLLRLLAFPSSHRYCC